MRTIRFTKAVATGNDFIIIDNRRSILGSDLSRFARNICERRRSAGADGLLVLGKSKEADLRMRIFNADGSEAEMCGNGARCAAYFFGKRNLSLETKAGIIKAQVLHNCVKIKLTPPKKIKLDLPLKVAGWQLKINFIDTGVPHAVIFVEGLDKINLSVLGRLVRYHRKFSPRGTNVNFIEVQNKNSIRIRTYERGVEGETLACGTGSAAGAIIFALKSAINAPVRVVTKGGEVLKVSFIRQGGTFKDLWLEGKAKIVYKGVYYV